jgi:hypothetical protein
MSKIALWSVHAVLGNYTMTIPFWCDKEKNPVTRARTGRKIPEAIPGGRNGAHDARACYVCVGCVQSGVPAVLPVRPPAPFQAFGRPRPGTGERFRVIRWAATHGCARLWCGPGTSDKLNLSWSART